LASTILSTVAVRFWDFGNGVPLFGSDCQMPANTEAAEPHTLRTQKHFRATEFIGGRMTSTAMVEARQSLKNLAASRVNIRLSE
jgi:hypothetical protein